MSTPHTHQIDCRHRRRLAEQIARQLFTARLMGAVGSALSSPTALT